MTDHIEDTTETAVTERGYFNETGTDGYSITTEVWPTFNFALEQVEDAPTVMDACIDLDITWCGNTIYLGQEGIETFRGILDKADAAYATAVALAEEKNEAIKAQSSVSE